MRGDGSGYIKLQNRTTDQKREEKATTELNEIKKRGPIEMITDKMWEEIKK